MQKAKRKTVLESGRVLFVSVDQIRPNPAQPRRIFDRESLQELAASISQFGILQPLTVRRREGCFELVAGERRLRAARIAGLDQVPCVLLDVDEEQSGLLALVENLQRKDLDYIEEAEGIARLLRVYGLSQEQAAKRLGKSPSAVANKLRLLKHSPAVLDALRQNRLSERHARALLRLPEEDQRLAVIAEAAKKELTVAQTEACIEKLLSSPPPRRGIRKLLLRDVRLFLNSLDHHLRTMQEAGIRADCGREETEDEIILTIRLPKRVG